MQFPEFQDFKRRPPRQNGDDPSVFQAQLVATQATSDLTLDWSEEAAIEVEQTPQETLEASYQSLRRTLAHELLERVKNSPPRFFEKLVVDLLVAMGYGGSRKDAGQAVGQSGDGGIDGIERSASRR